MSLVLHKGIKSNFIPPVTYLQRSTNSKQPLSMVHDRSSLPRSSRLLIKNISQKCSRDDRKMTLGGLHGHGMVQTSEVGPPMVPRGQVIYHQQRCRAQHQVHSPALLRAQRESRALREILPSGPLPRDCVD